MQPQSIAQQAGAYINMLTAADRQSTPYEICRQLAQCTGELMSRDELEPLRQALGHIASVYRQSECHATKAAIENVLVYSIGTQLMLSHERKHLMEALPEVFRHIIAHQMIASNI